MKESEVNRLLADKDACMRWFRGLRDSKRRTLSLQGSELAHDVLGHDCPEQHKEKFETLMWTLLFLWAGVPPDCVAGQE